MDATVDLIFLIDIMIHFRTTYLDTTLSEEVYDPLKIAKRYLRGSFFLDLVSTLPFAELFDAALVNQPLPYGFKNFL